MLPLEDVIAVLRRLEAAGWGAGIGLVVTLVAVWAVLVRIAWWIGDRVSAKLDLENTELTAKLAPVKAHLQGLDAERKRLALEIVQLQDARPENRLGAAAQHHAYGNDEAALQVYQEIFADFRPELVRCCEGLAAAAGGDRAAAQRYRRLAVRLDASGGPAR